MKRKTVLSFLLIALFTVNIQGINIFAQVNQEDTSVFEDEALPIETMKVIEEPASIFKLQSKSALLMDAATGQVIFSKNPHEKLPPASVTKIMSLILIMEAIDSGRIKLTDKVSCSETAAGMGGSQIYLEPGETMTVEDLLKSVVISSANDATVMLGEHVYGSVEGFVTAMNERAKELGMKDTHFVNATGLDDDKHLTCAYDIALMSRELINKHPSIHKYMTIWMDTVRNGEFGLANTNKLVRFYKGCDGIKTGSTSKAMFCVSETAVRNGFRLIAIVMAAPSSKVRFGEASKLLDHGFANYGSVLVGKKGDKYGKIKVSKGMKSEINCVVKDDVRILVKKGGEKAIKRVVAIDPIIPAPVAKGQKIGKVYLKLNSLEIGSFDLVAMESVKKAGFVPIIGKMLDSWFKAGR